MRLVGVLYGLTYLGHQVGGMISSWLGGWAFERFHTHWVAFGAAGALLLLQANGLIKLRPEAGLKATPIDVIENPKKLRFIELDAAQLPRSLDDTDASAVNTNFALEAGLNPAKDAIAQESPNSPYANVLVVREKDKDRPEFAKLVSIYHSPAVKQFIETKFKGAVVAAW